MGAFEKLFSHLKNRREMRGWFKMLNGYTPAFYTYDGGVYEMELTRACIHTFATHASKLQPTVTGPDRRGLSDVLNRRPNQFMTGSQFLYKAATIYEAQNTVFVLPILDRLDRTVGFYPADPQMVEVVQSAAGEPFLRVTFPSGEKAAIELARCGVVSKFLYHSDIFGEDNRCLDPTMQLLSMQTQGIAEGIKHNSSFRFMAQANNFTKPEDLKKERARFVEDNLGEGSGGLALFPSTYSNIKQIISTPRVVDPEQMRIIQERVFLYYGTNMDALQNTLTGEKWASYYEGKVEPFALMLSQAMTQMCYSPEEQTRKNGIVWSANRLQYMTNADKLQVSSQMFDRGIFCLNDIRDIWNLPHIEGGEKFYIRKEYTEISQLNADQAQLPEPAPNPQPEPEKKPEEVSENDT